MNDLSDFFKKLNVNEKYLKDICLNINKFYNSYYIKKKNKKEKRIIDAPSKRIKGLQFFIYENYLKDIFPISDSAKGFVKGKNIIQNAEEHIEKCFILTVDIKDFFFSIKEAQINNLFKKKYSSELAWILTKLTTYKGYLPQGAVTSPFLSNVCFFEIDEKIIELCKNYNVTYSRYADDLSFSSDDISKLENLYKLIRNVLIDHEFYIKHSKTRYLSRANRMSVTGLNINNSFLKEFERSNKSSITVPRKFKREKIRAPLYNYFVKKDKTISLKQISGCISFVVSVEPDFKQKIEKYINRISDSN